MLSFSDRNVPDNSQQFNLNNSNYYSEYAASDTECIYNATESARKTLLSSPSLNMLNVSASTVELEHTGLQTINYRKYSARRNTVEYASSIIATQDLVVETRCIASNSAVSDNETHAATQSNNSNIKRKKNSSSDEQQQQQQVDHVNEQHKQQPTATMKTTMKRVYCEDQELNSSTSSIASSTVSAQINKRHRSTSSKTTAAKLSESTENPEVRVSQDELKYFFSLLNDNLIREFLDRDSCFMVSDKYALAMVFVYFKRADLPLKDYTRMNFFLALYLANDIEEDCDEYKYEIFPWALGSTWRCKFQGFLKKRDNLLRNIRYRALVSRKLCEYVMYLSHENPIWQRERSYDHGGATRAYVIRKIDNENGESDLYIEDGVLLPRGPTKRPRPCPLCTIHGKKSHHEEPTDENNNNNNNLVLKTNTNTDNEDETK